MGRKNYIKLLGGLIPIVIISLVFSSIQIGFSKIGKIQNEEYLAASDSSNQKGAKKTEVGVEVVNNPKVDIMVTQKDTNLDMTNFEDDVLTRLQDYGIDTTNVNIQTVDRAMISTNASDASTIFNSWGRIGVTGNWQLTTYNGTSVIWNKLNTDGATGFYSKDNYNIKDATIDFDMRTTDSDDDYIGVFLRFNLTEDSTNQANKKATTYMYIEQMNGVSDFKAPNGLYKIQNKVLIPSDAAGNSITTLYGNPVARSSSGWPTKNAWVHYKFVVEGNNIKAYRNNTLIINYTDTTSTAINKGSFGLVNWSQPAMFANFTVSYTVFKEFQNVLREPTWREDAYHVVVNVDDTIDETLTGKDTIGEILSRTLNDDIHFIQWGSDTNREEISDFISRNDSKGLFTGSDDYTSAVDKTVEYIKNLIENNGNKKYVIVGEDNKLTVSPEELRTGAVSVDFPNGRWMLRHNYTYFANDLGQSTSAGAYTKDLACSFDKPGEYQIYFDDDLVKTVYAHRRPVASFLLNIDDGQITVNSNSFDLDSNEDIGYGKGIAKEKWYYKEVNDAKWTEGKITTFDNSKIYVIKLEVTDFQEETSYTTKYIGTGNPVATFNYNAETITKYQDLEITDTSYDPSGYEITNWTWVLRKGSAVIGTYNSKIPTVKNFNTSELGVGTYSYSLVVTNSQGIKSESYSKTFHVIEDTDAPEVLINPTYCDWKREQEVGIIFKDADSGFKNFRYAINDEQEITEETVWSESITESTYSLTIKEEGQKYLHIQAYDNAGNVLERTVGIYKIDRTDPDGEYIIIEPTDKIRAAVIGFIGRDEESGVAKIILPDGSEVESEKATYSVTKSGKYVFRVIDMAGNEKDVEVEVEIESEGVEVRYIDQVTGKEIERREEIKGKAGDKYTTEAKEIDGYELVKIPENATGNLEIDNEVVTYEYRKVSKVVIKYIDTYTKQEIRGRKEISYKEGDEYKTLPQGIEGYKVSKIPSNKDGIVERKNIEVVYEYQITTSGVTVKYIDEITNEEIARNEYIEGTENDRYETREKEIEGYKLVKIPENATGRMEFGTIEVIYEYRRESSGIVVRYIDQVTREEILGSEYKEGLENDEYETIEKEIEGYKLVKIPENAKGEMTVGITEIIYEYRKKSNIVIKYIDEITGEEILERTEIVGTEGEEYRLLPKNKDGYIVGEGQENEKGIIGRNDIEIVYKYRSISEGLVVKYIDIVTEEIIETKIYTGKENDVIELEEMKYEGYVLVKRPEQEEVTLTKELQEEKYYYKKEIKVQVIYIDENTGKELYREEKVGVEGEKYSIEGKEIEGYKLVRVPEEEERIYKREEEKIVYGYKKNSSGVKVKYIDQETGKVLEEREYEGVEGDKYKTEKMKFEKYNFMYSSGNTSGRMKEEITEVNYYYERKYGGVEIIYEDEKGNIILKEIISGKVDDEYKVIRKEIENYTIEKEADNAEGRFSLEKITVKYVVRKMPSEVSPDTGDINVYAYVAMFVISLFISIKKVYDIKNKI